MASKDVVKTFLSFFFRFNQHIFDLAEGRRRPFSFLDRIFVFDEKGFKSSYENRAANFTKIRTNKRRWTEMSHQFDPFWKFIKVDWSKACRVIAPSRKVCRVSLQFLNILHYHLSYKGKRLKNQPNLLEDLIWSVKNFGHKRKLSQEGST